MPRARRKNKHAVAMGRLGGKAAARNRTPEERSEHARKAGAVSIAKQRAKREAARRDSADGSTPNLI